MVGGDKGAIASEYLNHATPGKPLTLRVKEHTASNTDYDVLEFPGLNGFLAETESFAALVAGDEEAWTGTTPQESIDIALTIDAISRSARTDSWANVDH